MKFFTPKAYRKLLRSSIAVIYLIIIAGAVVRMTGSGMGCPDWPKCFGYYIPPTQVTELEFSANTDYTKGMVIILNDELRVAAITFKSTAVYNAANWNPYTKHDYAVFNVYHTWTEYINRLIGALGGLVVLVMAASSLQYFKTRRYITILSIVALLAMLIQAVIGKIVVDTNLSPALITIHMVVALLIVGLLLYLLHEVLEVDTKYENNGRLTKFIGIIIVLTLIQIVTGTQVRQYVDDQIDLLGYPLLSSWFDDGPIVFYIHRTYSTLLILLHVILYRKAVLGLGHPKGVYLTLLGLLVVTVLSGVFMNYLDFPFGSQAAHLVLASAILGFQFYVWMRCRVAVKNKQPTTEVVN
jgi:cytochrome c oxidase assembly protein subunit 15